MWTTDIFTRAKANEPFCMLKQAAVWKAGRRPRHVSDFQGRIHSHSFPLRISPFVWYFSALYLQNVFLSYDM